MIRDKIKIIHLKAFQLSPFFLSLLHTFSYLCTLYKCLLEKIPPKIIVKVGGGVQEEYSPPRSLCCCGREGFLLVDFSYKERKY